MIVLVSKCCMYLPGFIDQSISHKQGKTITGMWQNQHSMCAGGSAEGHPADARTTKSFPNIAKRYTYIGYPANEVHQLRAAIAGTTNIVVARQ
jgi:hypothetical protein